MIRISTLTTFCPEFFSDDTQKWEPCGGGFQDLEAAQLDADWSEEIMQREEQRLGLTNQERRWRIIRREVTTTLTVEVDCQQARSKTS